MGRINVPVIVILDTLETIAELTTNCEVVGFPKAKVGSFFFSNSKITLWGIPQKGQVKLLNNLSFLMGSNDISELLLQTEHL